MKTEENDKWASLKWVRIFDPVHIPRVYIDQIKDSYFTADKFYKMQKTFCIEEVNGRLILNPLNLLYVLVDENTSVKGFCWMVVDALSNALVINSFSMDNSYWGNGKVVKLLEDKAREIKDGCALDRVFWITRCPKHSEKYGFKKSKHILMEYVGHGRHNDREQCAAGRPSGSDDAGATELS